MGDGGDGIAWRSAGCRPIWERAVPADDVPGAVPGHGRALIEWGDEMIFCMWVAEEDTDTWKTECSPLDVRILKTRLMM